MMEIAGQINELWQAIRYLDQILDHFISQGLYSWSMAAKSREKAISSLAITDTDLPWT